ncbi:MAG: aldo/keto reductase [Solirubrobacteraceae bacterium]|nr:MAG: general stress protein [Solirubrobacterales bacterium]
MDTVTLGMTGLEVSPIAFGTWQLGGDWGATDERRAIDALRRARELGINFFDTAQAYGWGASERMLARALREDLDQRRDEVVIATKGGLRMTDDGLLRDSSPEWLRQGVEDSLAAMGIERIDLYQVHWPDPDTPLQETAGALQELVDEGKIGHVGVSNFGPEEMAEFARTRPVETLQPPYHLFRRDIEADVLPYSREQDIGVLVYGPLAHGLLSGAMDENATFDDDDWRSGSPLFEGELLARNLEAVRQLQALAAERFDASVSQLAVAWTLSHPAVRVAIVGSRDAEHIAEAIGASEIELSGDDIGAIEGIMAGAAKVGGPSPESV